MNETPPTHENSNGRVWYLRTALETDGELHEQRVEYRPGSAFPHNHYHPDQDEHFVVEQGSILFVIDGVEQVVSAGEEIDLPRGTPHKARNASKTEAAMVRWETRPALRTGEFFATTARLGDDAGLLDSALLARTYRDVFRLTGPLGAIVPLVGGLARLLGRRLPQ